MIETPWIYHEQLQPTGEALPVAYRRLAARVVILSLLSAFGPITYRVMHAIRRQVVTSHVFTSTSSWWCSPDVAMSIWTGADQALGLALHWADKSGLIAKLDGIGCPDEIRLSALGKRWLRYVTRQRPDNPFMVVSRLPDDTSRYWHVEYIELEVDQ